MTAVQIEYCGLIVKELFGQQPSRLFEFIVQHQPVPLKAIITRGKFAENDAIKSLWILIQHHLVEIFFVRHGLVTYKVDLKYALQRARHVRYVYIAHFLYGDEGKSIVEQVSKHGKADMNKVIMHLSQQLVDPASGTKNLYDKFCQLSQSDFITQFLPINVQGNNSLVETKNETHMGMRHKITGKRKIIESDDDNDDEGGSSNKRPKLEQQTVLAPILGLWKLNIDKFNDYWKHQIVVEAVGLRIDKRAAEVVKAILKLSDLPQHKSNASSTRTGGITYNEILNYFKKQTSPGNIIQILGVLTQDSAPLVIKDGDSDGGIYKIDFKKAFTELCKAHVSSIVQERYGSSSLRIFKLIQMKKVLDQKQIEDMVMMDAKDTRDLLFRLLKDGFLCQPEVSRGTDYMPMKTLYFFSVDLVHVAKMLLDQCYQAASNLIRRREYEAKVNKRVVDKQRRLEAILEQIEDDDEQKRELEDQMTPAEKAQVATYIKASDKIEKAELQLDETTFVLETFLSLQ